MNNNNRKFIERLRRLKSALQLKEKHAMRIYPYTNHWYINKQNKHTHNNKTWYPSRLFCFCLFCCCCCFVVVVVVLLLLFFGGTFSRGLLGTVLIYDNTINARKNVTKKQTKNRLTSWSCRWRSWWHWGGHRRHTSWRAFLEPSDAGAFRTLRPSPLQTCPAGRRNTELRSCRLELSNCWSEKNNTTHQYHRQR